MIAGRMKRRDAWLAVEAESFRAGAVASAAGTSGVSMVSATLAEASGQAQDRSASQKRITGGPSSRAAKVDIQGYQRNLPSLSVTQPEHPPFSFEAHHG